MKKHFTKLLLVLSICLSLNTICKAQYITGIGLRAGKLATGVDIKHFFDNSGNTAYEVFLGYTQEAFGGYVGKVFFIKQFPVQKSWIPFPFRTIFRQSRLQIPLKMVFGVGMHVGYQRDRYYSKEEGDILSDGYNTMNAGIDATAGLEYNTRRLPITIGLDATPFYSFLNPGKEFVDFGLNVRYIFR